MLSCPNHKVWVRDNEFFKQYISRAGKAYHRYIEGESNWRATTSVQDYNAPLTFPKPSGLDVNMMPIVLGDISTIPEDCQPYKAMLETVFSLMNAEEHGRVGYLTIQESDVMPGETQRRAGAHTDSFMSMYNGGLYVPPVDTGNVSWGVGVWKRGFPVGGIFMASNIAGSTRLWPVQIKPPLEMHALHQ